jgi:hypothetical protein
MRQGFITEHSFDQHGVRINGEQVIEHLAGESDAFRGRPSGTEAQMQNLHGRSKLKGQADWKPGRVSA